jgi:RNA polymerase sigma-70 factor (ECF subfamily)
MNMTTSEAELLQGAQQADEGALGEIYDVYSTRLYGYAYRLTGDDAIAKDVVAETFYRFLLALKDGGGPNEHIAAYLYRVAYHLVVDNSRRQPKTDLLLEETLVAAIDSDPGQNADEQQKLAREALWLLTAEQHQVILLKYFEGFNNEQVAVALGKPIGSIKSLQSRALAALRRALVEKNEGVLND